MMATKDYFHNFLAIIYIYFSSLLACYAFSIICYPCFTCVVFFKLPCYVFVHSTSPELQLGKYTAMLL